MSNSNKKARTDRLTSILEFTRSHWSEVITILLAIGGVVSEVWQTKSFGRYSQLLSVLALLAVSQLTNDYNLRKVTKAIENPEYSAEKFLQKSFNFYEVNEILGTAHTIDILGINLKDSLAEWFSIIEQRVAQGSKVRIIMLDPNCEGLKSAVLRSNGEDEGLLKAQYQFSLRKIQALVKFAPNKNLVELKLVKYAPSFALLVVDNGKPSATCLVKLYCHNGVVDGVYPFFQLYPWRELWWFNYFSKQFENEWLNLGHSMDNILKSES